jgi:hypothetical protein
MISIIRYSSQRRQPHCCWRRGYCVRRVRFATCCLFDVVIGVTEFFVTCTVLDVDCNVVAGVVVDIGVVVVGFEVVLQLELVSCEPLVNLN